MIIIILGCVQLAFAHKELVVRILIGVVGVLASEQQIANYRGVLIVQRSGLRQLFICTSLVAVSVFTVSISAGAASSSYVTANADASCNHNTMIISGLATNQSLSRSVTVKMNASGKSDGPYTLRHGTNTSFRLKFLKTSIKNMKVTFVGHWIGQMKKHVWFTKYVSGSCRTNLKA